MADEFEGSSQEPTGGESQVVGTTEGQATEGETQGQSEPEGEQRTQGRAKGVPDQRYAYERMKREVAETRRTMDMMRGELDTLRALAVQTPQQQQRQEELTDITSLDEDEIHRMWAEEPRKFAQLQIELAKRQARAEIMGELEERAQNWEGQQRRATETEEIKAFIKENPDFVDLYESGELQEHMRKTGYDWKPAYLTLTEENRFQARVEREIKKREEALRGKRGVAPPVSGGISPPYGSSKDPRLNDTSKHGGLEAVMAAKLREAGLAD